MGLGRWLAEWLWTGPNPHLSNQGDSGYWQRGMPSDDELVRKHFPNEQTTAAETKCGSVCQAQFVVNGSCSKALTNQCGLSAGFPK